MSRTASAITAEDLLAMPDDGNRYELIRGALRMMSPAGGRHGRIAMKLSLRIGHYVEAKQLGITFAAETGFLLEVNPDTVRAPDVAYVSTDKLGELGDHTGFLPLVPDLVAEVVSPGDRSSEVEEKATAWVEAGVACVLVVDPQTKSVRRYQQGGSVQVHNHGTLEPGEVLPGFLLDIDELFA